MWARLLLMLLLVGSLHTAPSTAEEHTPKVLHFAVIADVPSTELALELLRVAYSELGIEVVARTVPSRRALMMANIGVVDGDLFRIALVGKQYPDLVRVPYPLLYGQLHAVTNRPLLTGLLSLEQLPTTHLRAAVRRGVIIAEQAVEGLGMVPVRADSFDQMLALLAWDRVDLALISYVEGISPLNTEAWRDFYVIPEPVTRYTLYHYLHRRHAHLAAPLARVLEQLDRSGERARIMERVKNTGSRTGLSPTSRN